jgi:hypothetical protein
MDKPAKKGILDKTVSGQPILINNKGECYTVSKAIANVWDKLDGTKTVKEIAEDIPINSAINADKLISAIDQVVSQLREYDLVE